MFKDLIMSGVRIPMRALSGDIVLAGLFNHQPMSFRGQKSIGVLVLHGFTGSPWSMRPLAEHVMSLGYSVELPCLPGHGTSWQDMSRFSRHAWLAEVDRAYWRLRAQGCDVVIAGLSMGGALALYQSARRPVIGTIVINPYVVDPTPLLSLSPYAKFFISSTSSIASDIAVEGVDEGAYDRVPTAAAAQLHFLGRQLRPVIPSLSEPVLYFRSRQDHVVSDASHRYFLKNALCPVEFIELENSYHVATLDYDAPFIFEHATVFLTSCELSQKVTL